MTEGEDHQHHSGVLVSVGEWLEEVNDYVEEVERSPGDEEDDGHGDQHSVGLLPPLHLTGATVSGELSHVRLTI